MSAKTVILGAGVTGLSAGAKLAEAGRRVSVWEKDGDIGGMAATFEHNGSRLDLGPHKLFTVLEHIEKEMEALFEPGELLTIPKASRIRLRGRYFKYPLGVLDIFTGLGPWLGLACGFGYAWSLALGLLSPRAAVSYQDWVVQRFGYPIFNLVFGPYARKIWGDPAQLAREVAESRIAAPHLLEMLKQMLLGRGKQGPVISADSFRYPRQGSVEVCRKLAAKITRAGGEIDLRREPRRLYRGKDGAVARLEDLEGRVETLEPGDTLLSTVPLPALLGLFEPPVSAEAKQAARLLTTRNLILLYVELDGDRLIHDNWLFFPEERYAFNRVFEQKAFSPEMVPAGRTVYCAEITCSEQDALWTATDAELFARVRPQLAEVGLLPREPREVFTRRIPNGYPVYDLAWTENLGRVMGELDGIGNLFPVGRQGGFSYIGMADAMDIGGKTAAFILEGRDKAGAWPAVARQFYHYRVVD